MRKTINLDDIAVFVAASDAGTLRAAATELGLPTSTISRSLTRLEKHMNLLFVHRSQRGLVLTDTGSEYLAACKQALRILREGRELLDQRRDNPSGLLRIACPVTLARAAVAPLLSKFVENFPDLTIELKTYASGFEQEPKEDVDIFFKVRAPSDSSHRVRLYPGILRGLFASRMYVNKFDVPAEPADLALHRCVGWGSWTLSDGNRTVTPDLKCHLTADDPYVLRQLALDGAGITVLPLWLALQPTTARNLVRILPAWQPTPIVLCAIYSASARLTPKIQVFFDFIHSFIGTDLDPRLRGTKAKECFTQRE